MILPKERPFALAALILILGAFLPFVDQALHIDDQIYVMGAEIIEADPLRPYSARRGFLGVKVPYYRGINSHPEGLPYYLAALRTITGGRGDMAHHVMMLPFVFLLGLGVWGLARELRVASGWSALLLLGAAPVTVMSHTIMTDLPFLALFCAGLWALLRGHRMGGAGWTGLAVLACNLAWFTQYRGLLLLPIGLGWVLLTRRLSWHAAVALASMPVLFAGWCAWNLWELGKAHFFFSGGQIEWTGARLATSAAAMAAYAGGTLGPLALLAAHRLWGSRRDLALAVGGALLGGLLLTLALPERVPGPRPAIFALAAVGLFILGGAALAAWRSGEKYARPLALLLVGLAGLQVAASLFASTRMLLLPLPFLVLTLVAGQRELPRRLLTGVVLVSLCLGLFISRGDRKYANAYRDAAPAVAEQARAGGGDGYFVGEWGLRNYLEQQGLTYLTTYDRSPRKGDRIVIPGLNCPWPLHAKLQERLGEPVAVPIPAACALRTMDPALGAGFYSDGYGPLPFAFTARDKPYDVLKIYPVIK